MGDVTPLLLLLWAAVTVGSAVDLQKRIIWGQPCKNDEHQYHVKFVDEYDNLRCGGSLISNQWILTAAHCLYWQTRAVINVHQGQAFHELITDPAVMNIDQQFKVHDIMLLKLSHPIKSQVHLAQLPDVKDCDNNKQPNPPETVRIAGFGPTETENSRIDNNEPAHLQCADIPVTDCQTYRTAAEQRDDEFYKVSKHNHWICAQSRKVDAASGDSGGGVEYKRKLYGVISAGGVLAFDQPVLFINVCKHLDWIKKTAGIK